MFIFRGQFLIIVITLLICANKGIPLLSQPLVIKRRPLTTNSIESTIGNYRSNVINDSIVFIAYLFDYFVHNSLLSINYWNKIFQYLEVKAWRQ